MRSAPKGPVAARSPLSRGDFVRLAARLAGVGDRVTIGPNSTIDGAVASFAALKASGFDFDSHPGTVGVSESCRCGASSSRGRCMAQVSSSGQLFTPTTSEAGRIVDPFACRGIGGSPSLPGLNMANKARGEVPKGSHRNPLLRRSMTEEQIREGVEIDAREAAERERVVVAAMESKAAIASLEMSNEVLRSQLAARSREDAFEASPTTERRRR